MSDDYALNVFQNMHIINNSDSCHYPVSPNYKADMMRNERVNDTYFARALLHQPNCPL